MLLVCFLFFFMWIWVNFCQSFVTWGCKYCFSPHTSITHPFQPKLPCCPNSSLFVPGTCKAFSNYVYFVFYIFYYISSPADTHLYYLWQVNKTTAWSYVSLFEWKPQHRHRWVVKQTHTHIQTLYLAVRHCMLTITFIMMRSCWGLHTLVISTLVALNRQVKCQ